MGNGAKSISTKSRPGLSAIFRSTSPRLPPVPPVPPNPLILPTLLIPSTSPTPFSLATHPPSKITSLNLSPDQRRMKRLHNVRTLSKSSGTRRLTVEELWRSQQVGKMSLSCRSLLSSWAHSKRRGAQILCRSMSPSAAP